MSDMSDDFWGKSIFIYSRADAMLDGEQALVDDPELLEVIKGIGYKYPLYITRSVTAMMASSIASSNGARSSAGILHDILWMSRHSIIGKRHDGVSFTVKIEGVSDRETIGYCQTYRQQADIYELALLCSAIDHDNPAPCLTLMLPSEI